MQNITTQLQNFLKHYPLNAGEKIYELEQTFSNLFWMKNITTTSSWSTAIISSLKTLWIQKWDIILTTSINSQSVTNILNFLEINYKFVKSNNNTPYSMDTKDLENKIKQHSPKVIFIVHMDWYWIENTKEIIKLSKKYKIKTIEDCCQTIWWKIWKNYLWTLADIGIYSLDSNKMIKSWEWGIIITKNKNLLKKIITFKSNWKYKWNKKRQNWINFRYNDFAAIYWKHTLINLENELQKRKSILKLIQKKLKNTEIKILKETKKTTPSFYNITIKLPKQINTKNFTFISKIKNLSRHKNYSTYYTINLSLLDRTWNKIKENLKELFDEINKIK